MRNDTTLITVIMMGKNKDMYLNSMHPITSRVYMRLSHAFN